ncbi:USP6 N-terminal-like protein isoform X2 [Halichoerus grypus]
MGDETPARTHPPTPGAGESPDGWGAWGLLRLLHSRAPQTAKVPGPSQPYYSTRAAKLKKHLDEEQMCTGIYTAKWFLQCFIDQLWDAYILDGERVLSAMAYTILKMHSKRLLKLPLEGLREFLQDTLAQPRALEDEVVLRHLRSSMAQL